MWLPEHLPTYHVSLSIVGTHEYVNKKDIVRRNTLQLEDTISPAMDIFMKSQHRARITG